MEYWDTSALLKLYVVEADSGYFLRLIARGGLPVYTSTIASTEVLCALLRKESVGDLRDGGAKALFRRFRKDCDTGRVLLAPYGEDVSREAERLGRLAFARSQPALIRSLDLIHVATASVGKAAAVIATDKRLRALASLLKLNLLPATP
jgi:predicted nucleic acid-binding protein